MRLIDRPMRALRPSAVFVLLIAGLLAAPSCSRGPVQPYAPLAAGAEPLRSDFNRDAGRVRIVMVPAPT